LASGKISRKRIFLAMRLKLAQEHSQSLAGDHHLTTYGTSLLNIPVSLSIRTNAIPKYTCSARIDQTSFGPFFASLARHHISQKSSLVLSASDKTLTSLPTKSELFHQHHHHHHHHHHNHNHNHHHYPNQHQPTTMGFTQLRRSRSQSTMSKKIVIKPSDPSNPSNPSNKQPTDFEKPSPRKKSKDPAGKSASRLVSKVRPFQATGKVHVQKGAAASAEVFSPTALKGTSSGRPEKTLVGCPEKTDPKKLLSTPKKTGRSRNPKLSIQTAPDNEIVPPPVGANMQVMKIIEVVQSPVQIKPRVKCSTDETVISTVTDPTKSKSISFDSNPKPSKASLTKETKNSNHPKRSMSTRSRVSRNSASRIPMLPDLELGRDMLFLTDEFHVDEKTQSILANYDARHLEDFCLMTDKDFKTLTMAARRIGQPLPPLQIRKVQVLREWAQSLQKRQETSVALKLGTSSIPKDWKKRFIEELPKLKEILRERGEESISKNHLFDTFMLFLPHCSQPTTATV
jgi:hypothetical protein